MGAFYSRSFLSSKTDVYPRKYPAFYAEPKDRDERWFAEQVDFVHYFKTCQRSEPVEQQWRALDALPSEKTRPGCYIMLADFGAAKVLQSTDQNKFPDGQFAFYFGRGDGKDGVSTCQSALS